MSLDWQIGDTAETTVDGQIVGVRILGRCWRPWGHVYRVGYGVNVWDDSKIVRVEDRATTRRAGRLWSILQ